MEVVFIVNNFTSFITHRLPIGKYLITNKHDVNLCAPFVEQSELNIVEQEKINYIPMPLNRTKVRFMSVLRCIFLATKLAIQKKNAVFHLVTIIPIILFGFPLRIFNRKCVLAVSGLGTVFTSEKLIFNFIKPIVLMIYQFIFKGVNSRVILQNQDDYNFFKNKFKIDPIKLILIKGSGVNDKDFPFFEENEGEKNIALVPARLIKDKGIFEMVDASSLLLKNGFQHEVWFAGDIDLGNPHSLTEEDINKFKLANSSLHFLGRSKDMSSLYQQSTIVCLPSYREGLPKALIEASASGRAIITTDVPGCREIISHNNTGLLIEAKSSQAIADAMNILFMDKNLRKKLLTNSYNQFVSEYKIESVIFKTMNIYESF